MSTKPERDWSRAHAAEHVITGGALLGAAAVGNYANDKALERRGLQKPFKTVMQRKKLKPAHARFVGVKAVTRAGQIVGLPMAAYGAYNAIRPDHKVPRVSVKRDVVKPVGRALAMADAKDHYRRVIKRDLSQVDSKKLLRRKRIGRDLSLVGGTLGGMALALRSPEIARVAASRSKRLAATRPVRRLAALEPKATKTSNTLGIAAIGSGSVGSFNYASQQRLEAKQIKKALQPYAILSKIGRVRVTGMHAKDMFTVVDGKDTKRLVHRSRLQFIKTPGKRKPQGPTQLPLPFEKRDDRFLREHRDRISPDAERGYNSMRRQRNKDRAWAATQAGLAGVNAAGLVQAVRHRSKVWIPVTAATTAVSAVQAVRHGRKATAYDRGPMEGIRRKARERARSGLYGPGRGMEPVDASSRRVGKAGGQGGYSHSEAKRQWKASGAVPRAAGAASSQPRAAKPAKPLKYALRDAVMGKPSAQERRRRWMESGSPREGSVRTAKRPRRGPSWVDPAQYRIPRHMKLRAAGSAGVALAGVGGIAAYERLRKDRKAETVAGGVAGVAAADAASVYGGQKAKYALKRRRDAKLTQMRRTDRAAYNTAMRDWRAHLDRHGVDRVSEKMSASQRAKVMGRYPKSMPGWRGQRALALKNKPVVSGAIYAAGALAGAAAGRQVGKALVPRLPVPRSLPKGLVRRPTLRRSYVARRPSGLQVSVRGGFG